MERQHQATTSYPQFHLCWKLPLANKNDIIEELVLIASARRWALQVWNFNWLLKTSQEQELMEHDCILGFQAYFTNVFLGGPNASSLVGSLGICCLPRHFMKLIGHFISIFPPVSDESKFQNLNGYWVVPKASRTRTSNDFFWTNHSKIRIKRFIKWSGGWGLDTHTHTHLTVYLCHEKKGARYTTTSKLDHDNISTLAGPHLLISPIWH